MSSTPPALAVLFCILRIHLNQERKQSMRYVIGERIKIPEPTADTRLNSATS
jgi:hypothetical protein